MTRPKGQATQESGSDDMTRGSSGSTLLQHDTTHGSSRVTLLK